MDFILILLKGIAFGLGASIPLGPIGVLIIQRTLGKGKRSGIVSGLGATVADTILAIIAGLGITMIIDFIEAQKFYFQLIGGLFVIIIGYRTFYSDPVKQLRTKNSKYTNWHGDFLSVLALTITNPLAVFLFLAVFASLNLLQNEHGYLLQILLIGGITLGSLIWWLTLSGLVSFYRERIRLKNLYWINKITGIIIVIFGLVALISIFYTKSPIF